jgi:hypothetical protein
MVRERAYCPSRMPPSRVRSAPLAKRGQLSPRLQKQRWPVDIPKMPMSNVMNQSAPRTSWVIASS